MWQRPVPGQRYGSVHHLSRKMPSPPWGRGWPATEIPPVRQPTETGEGVSFANLHVPYAPAARREVVS
ncbi:hypothetical protein SBA2_270055 [Acidobacteriia bacterium SbA2]|nr:hypothetical protein SBA2_270055 [Acidobacteriia bacterium SbA2]